MNILQHITEKVAALEGEIVRVLVVPNGGMTHALVLAHMGEDLFSTWVSCTTSDKVWRGLSSGHHDMTLAEAEADFELRAAETTPFATTRLRTVDKDMEQAAELVLSLPPVKWAAWHVENFNSDEKRQSLVNALERLATQAARMARYMERRGDRGSHNTAVMESNKAGRGVWCKVFGYNACPDINF